MKKILCIVVLSLLLNGNAFAKKISSYEDLDLTSKPKKVLSKSETKSLWNAYKKECEPPWGAIVGRNDKAAEKSAKKLIKLINEHLKNK